MLRFSFPALCAIVGIANEERYVNSFSIPFPRLSTARRAKTLLFASSSFSKGITSKKDASSSSSSASSELEFPSYDFPYEAAKLNNPPPDLAPNAKRAEKPQKKIQNSFDLLEDRPEPRPEMDLGIISDPASSSKSLSSILREEAFAKFDAFKQGTVTKSKATNNINIPARVTTPKEPINFYKSLTAITPIGGSPGAAVGADVGVGVAAAITIPITALIAVRTTKARREKLEIQRAEEERLRMAQQSNGIGRIVNQLVNVKANANANGNVTKVVASLTKSVSAGSTYVAGSVAGSVKNVNKVSKLVAQQSSETLGKAKDAASKIDFKTISPSNVAVDNDVQKIGTSVGVASAGVVAFGLIASGEKRPSSSSTRTTRNNSIKQDVVNNGDSPNQRAVEDSIEVQKVKKAHISSENNVSSSVSSINIVDKAISEKKDKLVPPVVGTEVQPETRTIAKVDEPNQLVDSNQPGVKTAPLGVIAIVALTALRSSLINAKAGREELQRKERMEKFQLDMSRAISRAQEAASEARDELAELKDDGTT